MSTGNSRVFPKEQKHSSVSKIDSKTRNYKLLSTHDSIKKEKNLYIKSKPSIMQTGTYLPKQTLKEEIKKQSTETKLSTNIKKDTGLYSDRLSKKNSVILKNSNLLFEKKGTAKEIKVGNNLNYDTLSQKSCSIKPFTARNSNEDRTKEALLKRFSVNKNPKVQKIAK